MDENLKKIKEIILQTAREMNIEIDRIILFGSRARGDYKEDSDYDLLIVTKNELKDENIFWKFYSKVHQNLIDLLNMPIDLIIISKQYFEKEKNKTSKVYYWAEKEGILI
ncbi:MAG: nucleotidyltransferase domain-containing protein [Candidatus Aenigmatarchaeota archaeon]